MKYIRRLVGIFTIFVLLQSAYCAGRHVTVEINYGGLQQNRTVETPWKQGITALDVLKSVAKLETQQTGEYILVTSIDGIRAERGNMAWYYNINSKRAPSFANKYILNEGDHVQWEYKKDVCSPDIDSGSHK